VLLCDLGMEGRVMLDSLSVAGQAPVAHCVGTVAVHVSPWAVPCTQAALVGDPPFRRPLPFGRTLRGQGTHSTALSYCMLLRYVRIRVAVPVVQCPRP
jgi:hypothetical protein